MMIIIVIGAPDAKEALPVRPVSEVVPPDELDDAVARVTKRIDGAPRDL
jgi:hypothetical protein